MTLYIRANSFEHIQIDTPQFNTSTLSCVTRRCFDQKHTSTHPCTYTHTNTHKHTHIHIPGLHLGRGQGEHLPTPPPPPLPVWLNPAPPPPPPLGIDVDSIIVYYDNWYSHIEDCTKVNQLTFKNTRSSWKRPQQFMNFILS